MEEITKIFVVAYLVGIIVTGVAFLLISADIARAHTVSLVTQIDATGNVMPVTRVDDGIPKITVGTPEQFLEMVGEGRIYTYLEVRSTRVDKIYAAFIEDGKALLIYRHSAKGEGLIVDRYTPEAVYFVSSHQATLLGLPLLFAVSAMMGGLVAIPFVFKEQEIPKTSSA